MPPVTRKRTLPLSLAALKASSTRRRSVPLGDPSGRTAAPKMMK